VLELTCRGSGESNDARSVEGRPSHEVALPAPSGSNLLGALHRGLPQELNLLAIYVQTFLAFPALTHKWTMQEGSLGYAFLPAVIAGHYAFLGVSIFQIFDLLGRLAFDHPKLQGVWPSSSRLWILIGPRSLILIPCYLGWQAPGTFFAHPVSHFLTMSALAASNGILTSAAFTSGVTEASDADRDVIARAMPLALLVGITLGAQISSTAVMHLEHLSSL